MNMCALHSHHVFHLIKLENTLRLYNPDMTSVRVHSDASAAHC